MAILLVITADDLGIDARRDAGILRAHARGRVTHASLLVNGEHAALAARAARRQGLACGLHLNLTEGPPCAPVDAVRSLVDDRGSLLGKHGFRAALAAGSVRASEVCVEAAAQLRRFVALLGDPPTHVDGHQHAHAIPRVAEALAPCLAAHGVTTTRVPAQPTVALGDDVARSFYEGVRDDAARSRPIYARHGVRAPDAFFGLDWSGLAASPDALDAALRAHADARSLELMCHPGLASSRGDVFNRCPGRPHELSVLTSDAVGALLAARGVTLATMRDLAARGALS